MLYDLPKPKDGEVFCEFNVNPKKNISLDCSIRATALAFDISYDKAYRNLCEFGIKMSSLAKMNNKDMFSRLQEGERLMLK